MSDIGPKDSLASPNIFIMPLELRPLQITPGKFLGSSTLHPFNSLKLWRTFKSFSGCGWTLFRRSRTPSSTQQIFDPEWCHSLSFFLSLGTSSPELFTDELRCRFLGVADGSGVVFVAAGAVETAADGSVAGYDGLMGGKSNGCGEWMGPFLGFSTVKVVDGGGMGMGGGVVRGLIVRYCSGDEWVDREGPKCGVDLSSWFSRFLKSSTCSNFS